MPDRNHIASDLKYLHKILKAPLGADLDFWPEIVSAIDRCTLNREGVLSITEIDGEALEQLASQLDSFDVKISRGGNLTSNSGAYSVIQALFAIENLELREAIATAKGDLSISLDSLKTPEIYWDALRCSSSQLGNLAIDTKASDRKSDLELGSNQFYTNRTYNGYSAGKSCVVKGATFQKCVFLEGLIQNVVFDECNFSQSSFINCDLRNVTFNRCTGDRIVFTTPHLMDLSFARCRWHFDVGFVWMTGITSIEYSRMEGIDLYGTGELSHTTINQSLLKGSMNNIRLKGA